jgi:sec-independent protein translocase protein TatC
MAKHPNDDLFAGTTMTFGEHLDELRVVLFKAVAGLIIGFLLGLLVANYVVEFVQTPLKAALEEYYLVKAKKQLATEYKDIVPPEMLQTIKDRGLIPEMIHVEPQGILTSLIAADPETFGELHYKPHRFVLADIEGVNYGPLCLRLKQDSASTKNPAPPGQQMWKLMTDQQRQLVERLAAKTTVSRDDQVAVIKMLNELIEMPELHKSEEFKKVTLITSETEKAVKQLREQLAASHEADHSRRLNKLLVASAFPKLILPPRMLLVDMPSWKPTAIRVQALGAHEVFMIWIKAGFISGMIIASPWIFLQIWTFVAAGLYPHERRYVFIYLPFSLLLFLAGAALAFFFVFKPVLDFLFSFNAAMHIDPDPRISEWLSFVLIMPLGFGISFQLPLVMLFLNRIGIFSVEVYLEKWRIAILAIFVISMFLTPADPVSMMLMAVPLTFLYFGGVCLCKWMPRGRNPFDEAYEP